MSLIQEWIKVIPKALTNGTSIVEGVINSVKMENGSLPEDQQNEIIRRRLICETCSFMSENAKTSKEYLEVAKVYYKTDRTDKHCSLCACPITTKTACLSCACGAKAFNKENKTNIEVKFEEYA